MQLRYWYYYLLTCGKTNVISSISYYYHLQFIFHSTSHNGKIKIENRER